MARHLFAILDDLTATWPSWRRR